MQEFVVNTIQSGEEGDYLWVGLQFESPISVDDRLQIQCGMFADEQERRLGMDKIYLERLDQIQAGYGAASSIVVTADAIQFDFTPEGQRQLGFTSTLRMLWAPSLDGYEQARENLAKMQTYEWGRIIRIE